MLRSALLPAVLLLAAITAPQAQQAASDSSGIKRTPLQRFEVPGTGYETVIGMAEIAPNVSIGRHTHFGPESGYVLEGEFTLLVEGQPEKPLKAGQSYQVPPAAAHDARSGAQGAKIIATYVVEKGKPLATPAP
jgi:quercetin dioxygenase-like cupin family protein